MTPRWAPVRADIGAWSCGVVLDGRPGTWEATVAVLRAGWRFGRGGTGVRGFGLGSVVGVRFVRDTEDRMVLVFVGRVALVFGWHLHYPRGA